MYPPVFETVQASSPVTALLGTNPLRLYLFGQASQNTPKPYAVWQLITGSPYNHLKSLPDTDRFTTQIDVYATTAAVARQVAEALRNAFEPVAYVVGWRGESRDTTTQNYRYSFDVDWHVKRPAPEPEVGLFTLEATEEDTIVIDLTGTDIDAVWGWSGGADVTGNQFSQLMTAGQTVTLKSANVENIEQIVFAENVVGELFDITDWATLTRLEIGLNLTGALADLGTIPSGAILLLSNNAIAGTIPAGITASSNFYVDNCSLTGSIPMLTGGFEMESASFSGNSGITGVAGDFAVPASLVEFYAACSLTEAAVDAILEAFDIAGASGGVLDLSGGTNEPPSASGLTSRASLQGRGWNVSVNS